MKKFKLTPKGKVSGKIYFPQNDKTGDSSLLIDFNKITDAEADQLWNRKDEKGPRYLELKEEASPAPKAEATPKAKPVSKAWPLKKDQKEPKTFSISDSKKDSAE